LDAGVSCADVEREFGEQKSACGDSIVLIVAIVSVVVLLGAAVGGLTCVRHHKGQCPPVAESQRARPSVLQHGMVLSNPMYATVDCSDRNIFEGNFNFLSCPTVQNCSTDKVDSVATSNTPQPKTFSEPSCCNNNELGDRSQPTVFVSGAKSYLIPMEGDGSDSSQIYVEPSSGQATLYDAAKQPRENQATAYALPLPVMEPTYALPIASTNSIEVYTDVAGNSIPMFVEHIDGGYSQVRGGQLYVDTPHSAQLGKGLLMHTLDKEMAAEANSSSTDNGHSMSLGNQAQHCDLANAALGGTSANGTTRGRIATDWSNSSEQPANVKLPSPSDSVSVGRGGIKRSARSGSVYAGFADAVAEEGSAA
jgi:hypothetical protein